MKESEEERKSSTDLKRKMRFSLSFKTNLDIFNSVQDKVLVYLKCLGGNPPSI